MLRRFSKMWSGELGRISATEHRILLKSGARTAHLNTVCKGTRDAWCDAKTRRGGTTGWHNWTREQKMGDPRSVGNKKGRKARRFSRLREGKPCDRPRSVSLTLSSRLFLWIGRRHCILYAGRQQWESKNSHTWSRSKTASLLTVARIARGTCLSDCRTLRWPFSTGWKIF